MEGLMLVLVFIYVVMMVVVGGVVLVWLLSLLIGVGVLYFDVCVDWLSVVVVVMVVVVVFCV